MKKRNRAGRKSMFSSRQKAHEAPGRRGWKKRTSWTFERLEDRYYFSATPVEFPTVYPTAGPLNADAAWLSELQWAQYQAANATIAAQPQYAFMSLPNDPLLANQWHLLNTGQEVGNPDLQHLFGVFGQDINVAGAWNLGYTGAGVLVGVFDSGVQLFHPDLTANIHPSLRLNATTGTNNASPSLQDPTGFHGTAVAGLIGAVANNGIGGSGVAPGVTLVPIRRDFTNPLEETRAFQWAIENGIDITNNSWGPIHSFHRGAFPLTPAELEILRNSVTQGRDGLGIIHVFSSGNDGGPFLSPGFGVLGNYDSSSYNAWVNSRYTIGVTGVDHDGLYINADGTFTTYPTAGPSVLVAAPTGSNGAIIVAEDDGYGSGLWTTDLVGDFGFNAEPLPSGFDPDNDPWPDPDYTSRFNGTSASAPLVSGVIALMLEANPNLTYRDVQEILLRSARQNAEFEFPASGGLGGIFSSKNTWQMNQIGPFRNPDPWVPNSGQSPITSIWNPTADPNKDGFFFGGDEFAPDRADGSRQFSSHYEPQPGLFANGAGYTVSQGYGVYSEQIGYAHGVVDAELAVKMAEQWHTLGQNMLPRTEATYTTSIVVTAANLPAAEQGVQPPEGPGFIVPGGWYGLGGFIDYWNEYFADDDPAELDDGPFADYDGPPAERRGSSYIDFAVPPNQAMNVEWVEVKFDISGPAEDLDFIRIMLTSPDGTQSELNNWYLDPDFGNPLLLQPNSSPIARLNPLGDIDLDGGTFVWTFSTNRNFGESTNTAVIIDPVTGEPLLQEDPFSGLPLAPIFRDWELHVENWSNSDFGINAVEVVWHGKPIAGGALDPNWNVAKAQRVQGHVGIDTNGDELFNFRRSVQTVTDSDGDPDTIRLLDVVRQPDFTDVNLNGVYDAAFDIINQEPFAENILVEAYRVNPVTGGVDTSPTARFLTGADGNYYFDLDPTFEYEIRVADPLGRQLLDDTTTPESAPAGSEYLAHFQQAWRITPDWFFAPDRDNPIIPGNEPGEILFGMSDANGDGIMTAAPLPFMDVGAAIPMAVKNINFLIKDDAPANEIIVNGTVYADLNGDGAFNGDDVPAGGILVYHDANRNGVHDPGETPVATSEDPDPAKFGKYQLSVPATAAGTFSIGVIPPSFAWEFTNPDDGAQDIFASPGDVLNNVNFFLDPPGDDPGGTTEPGTILGFVFADRDADQFRDAGEAGVPGFRVFIDANENGAFDAGEAEAITTSNGTFFFAEVAPGLHRIDIEIANEGSEDASWKLTTPTIGYREVNLGAAGAVTGVMFGVQNRAGNDWGDLPAPYPTLASDNGPNHAVIPGFRLGNVVDGEVNGIPSAAANGDDLIGNDEDGVIVVSNGGVLQAGANTVRVTVAGVGGLLNGWMDFNNDGDWDDAGEQIFTNRDLNPGTHNLSVVAPHTIQGGTIASRFRWGTPNLSYTGFSPIGEVEDYLLPSAAPVVVPPLPGDFDSNGQVDNADYALWKSTFGSTLDLRADGNNNGVVDTADVTIWRDNFGAVASAAAANSVTSSQGTGSQLQTTDSVSAPVTEPAATGSGSALLAFSTMSFSTTSDGQGDSLVISQGTPVESVSLANLALLDDVLAGLAEERDEDDSIPLSDAASEETEEAYSDLALAAVFDEETYWRLL